MAARTVLLIGESLFGETLEQTLRRGGVRVLATAASADEALERLGRQRVDAVIVATTGVAPSEIFGRLLDAHPEIPIIRADLAAREVQVITSQRVEACSSDLLAALAALPARRTEA